jgi:hypothetical protein
MDNVIKPMETVEQSPKKRGGLLFLIVFFAVVLGVASGYGLVKTRGQGGVSGERIKTEKEVGIKDEQTFKDSAEGKLQKGGIDGEGTHHLVRTGGVSQTVCLTSSVVDLDQFVGKKVKVYGQTFAAKNAGWLMDVGRVEVK